jgi:hypothetical protein
MRVSTNGGFSIFVRVLFDVSKPHACGPFFPRRISTIDKACLGSINPLSEEQNKHPH